MFLLGGGSKLVWGGKEGGREDASSESPQVREPDSNSHRVNRNIEGEG